MKTRKTLTSMEHVRDEKRMKVVVPLTLKNRRFRELIIAFIKYIKDFSKTKKSNVFYKAVADRNSSKLLVWLKLFLVN